MLKIIKIMLVSMLLLLSTPAFVFANETETTENIGITTSVEIDSDTNSEVNSETEIETETEIEIEAESEVEFNERDAIVTRTELGARIRVIQLKDSLEHQLKAANYIIDYIENNKNESTENLQDIADNFNALIEEINSMNLENKTSDELAKEFVAIKERAIENSQNFKRVVDGLLTDEEKNQIRTELSELRKENIQDRKEDLRLLIREHNSQITQRAFEKLGVDLREIAQRIQSGEIDPTEIKLRIREEFNNLNETSRERIEIRFREDAQKIRIESKERIDDLRVRIDERKAEIKIRDGNFRAEIKDDGEIRLRDGENRFEIRKDGEVRIEENGQRIRIREDGRVEIKDESDEKEDESDEKEDESDEKEDENLEESNSR